MARSASPSIGRRSPARWFPWLYRGCASLQLGVVLIATLAVVLACATFLESHYGDQSGAVRFGIYEAWWFAALIGLLALNVLCSALIRYPWKRRHVGFLITHAGILLLLLGCLLTTRSGIHAMVSVYEGRSEWRAFEQTQNLVLDIEADDPSRSETVTVPFSPGPFHWQDYEEKSFFPWGLTSLDKGVIYDRDGIRLEALDFYSNSKWAPLPQPVPFQKDVSPADVKQAVQLQLTVDGRTRTFWLRDSVDPPELLKGESVFRKVVAGKNRRVAVVLGYKELDLGFRVFLHKFNLKRDPGSRTESHFSSLIDFRDRHDENKCLQKDVTITMNVPASFCDPGTGRWYRLYQSGYLKKPLRPGDPQFERMVAGREMRDRLNRSGLAVSYDPGRGIKYVGSLLICVGIVLTFSMRPRLFKSQGKQAEVH